MPKTLSSLARMTANPRQVHPRTNPTPWGLCVHTTGSGVPIEAQKRNLDPLAYVEALYATPGNDFPHYVMGYDGTLVQIADETMNAWHVAISPDERAMCLDGTWAARCSVIGVNLWKNRWPNHLSPVHLYPSTSPNQDYLGVELVPKLNRELNGTLHTDAQYTKLAALIDDIEQRYQIILTGPRLVAHEDLSPVQRWNSFGGWDPGFLRINPTFQWGLVFGDSTGVA